jgi:NTP pyrophosphatase (non-canonical NTP hydrolase)
MNMYVYADAALRTARDERTELPPLWYLALGLNGEAGEVADLVKKFERHAKPFDRQKMIDELGDVLWYLTVTAAAAGTNLVEVAKANVAKLEARYPNGFMPAGGGQDADRAAWEAKVNVIPFRQREAGPAGEDTSALAMHPEHPAIRVQATNGKSFQENKRIAIDRLWSMIGNR